MGARLAIGLCVLVTLGVGLFPNTVVSLAEHGTPILIEPPAPTQPPPGTGEPTPSSTTTTLPSSLQLQQGS